MSDSTLIKPQHLFYQHRVPESMMLSSEFVEETYKRNMPYGVMEVQAWRFDGIHIRHAKNSFNGHYLFENRNEEKVVNLEFNLRGNYYIYHYGTKYEAKARQHNIIYTPGVHNTFENKDLKGETFVIQFVPEVFLNITKDGNDVLKRFADKMMEGKPVVISQSSPLLTLDLEKSINEILTCQFTGGLKKLFLLSKSIEILVMQAEAFDKAEKDNRSIIKSSSDTDRIIYAKEYLEQKVDNPPSLSQLSKVVGLNEYKLKRGFKEVFNTTAFGYLAEYRLELAKQQLLESEKSISEISYQLGYSSPQHFSNAFKKKFGMAPKMAK
jgi:AraC family transcriptional regulator, transcriptional activator of the genes for pyochelin and ferripyochelin receptors